MKLGVRLETVRRQLPVLPAVVVVPDERSYVIAISRWSLQWRYPVLIDDGRWETRELIARFVRGFAPEGGATLVRWTAPAEMAWPGGGPGRQKMVDAALARSWEVAEGGSYLGRLKDVSAPPPGVVVADIEDGAWTAGLALAAGRGQVLVWSPGPTGVDVNGACSLKQADELSERIVKGLTGALEGTGWGYSALGDEIDSVTLAMNTPARVLAGASEAAALSAAPRFVAKANESWALTDVIGRSPRGNRQDRWAWCGQVFGTPAEAAYRAMCALFVRPEQAWLFHGYGPGQPWDGFSMGPAARALSEQGGLKVTVHDSPNQSATLFRDAVAGGWATAAHRSGGANKAEGETRGGLWAGLVAVNTSGNAEFFDLKPGRCLAGDVPILGVPAVTSFVHSWSAQQPGAWWTIAGRAFAHGTYAYVGSVHEPFLHAFQPTPTLMKRWLTPAPLGAAARLDQAPVWRVAVLGDPLLTLGPPAPVSGATLPLPLASPVAGELREQLRGQDLAAGLGSLVMLGRDADAVRLLNALADDPQRPMTPGIALAGVSAAFRAADLAALERCLAMLEDEGAKHPLIRDMAWHALGASIGTRTRRQVELLATFARDDSLARDGEELARALHRLGGRGPAVTLLDRLAARTQDQGVRKELERIKDELK